MIVSALMKCDMMTVRRAMMVAEWLLAIVMASAFVVACGDGVPNIRPDDIKNVVRLQKDGMISIPLDSETINIFKTIQYCDNDCSECLLALNENNNSIYRYDFADKSMIKLRSFDKRFFGKLQGFRYCSDDSLFTFSYSKGVLSHYSLRTDSLVGSINIRAIEHKDKSQILPFPYPSTTSPIISSHGYVWMSGMVYGESLDENENNRPGLIRVDIDRKDVRYFVNYPWMYQKMNWGGGLVYRTPYYDIAKNNIVVSFSASNELCVYSIDDGTMTFPYAGSAMFDKIPAYPKSKRNIFISEEDVWDWYMDNPSYEGVLYDRYRDVYYRFVRMPAGEELRNCAGNRKPVSIVILNADMEVVGETRLDSSVYYMPSNCFVSRDGLNIQVVTKNEDELYYETYKLVYE